jgi:hypothetical protein
MSALEHLETVEEVVEAYPNRIHRLVDALDPVVTGPEGSGAEEPVRAGRAILEYYRESDVAEWLRSDSVAPRSDTVGGPADAVLEDEFTFQGVTGTVPRRDGHLEWSHEGPRSDIEWAYFLNRHNYFGDLLDAFRETGNPEYAATFDYLVCDWVVSNPPPSSEVSAPPWRTLEVGLRLDSWIEAFYGFLEAEAFTPAGRLLLLSAVPPQAEYLRQYHKTGGNWATMELNGLGSAAVVWPEFRRADDWFTHAKSVLEDELTRQVYPDGVQKELSMGYHITALQFFQSFVDTASKGGHDLTMKQSIGDMWTYTAEALKPDGTAPLCGDSDRRNPTADLLGVADWYSHPEWEYICTNGAAGEPPASPPSRFFPWAGQLISRSGWSENAQWSFFDIGPYGTGHQHNDKLHLSVHAGGRDLLVDTGRFAYDGDLAERFRNSYAQHSRGHNVILIDGAGQGPAQQEATSPIESGVDRRSEFDVATGAFDAEFEDITGCVRHGRAVYYRRGAYWVVIDHVDTDRNRTIQPLWHFHPDCTLQQENDEVVTTDDGETNLRVVPTSNVDWSLEVVSGQESPPQGWYSEEYNDAEPAPAAVYEAEIESSRSVAWLLVPGETPTGSITWTDEGNLRIHADGYDPERVRVHDSDSDSKPHLTPSSQE